MVKKYGSTDDDDIDGDVGGDYVANSGYINTHEKKTPKISALSYRSKAQENNNYRVNHGVCSKRRVQ